ncbi:Condensin complex subunit 3 [Ceratobasidium theobromae]|uniref:Condensin complex subunit 3 n=1 Tax=Ceratobasidium theobromae TaxID=1582974 RepID=A0A5N5QSL7_9AGAM|nr:Condensin complex subunit 3 [Ceratobasidium theobromae]
MRRTKQSQSAEPPTPETFTSQIPEIFQQAQTSTANHNKNYVALSKLFSGCAGIYEEVQGRGGGIRLTGEKSFQLTFAKMVNNVLPVKKGVSNADRVVKFIGGFVKFITDRAAQQKAKERQENQVDSDEEDDDTPASRFVTYLLKYVLQGFMAKDKNVRYRCVHIAAEMISGLGEIDEDIYESLRSSLLERTQDKETFVRLQAAIALAKLARGEDMQREEREIYLSDILIDMIQHDAAPEVRRAALLNFAPSQKSLKVILSRTRDVDTTLRKLVYHHVLSSLKPEVLSLAQREEIVSNGLGDREPSVRGAAARMIGTWVDAKGGDLLEFLRSFDLLKSKVAEDALLSVFVTRADVFDNVEFGEDYWKNLTPERAFLARVFIEHCVNTKDNDRLEMTLPVVTLLAFRIQEEYNKLLELLRQLEARGNNPPADDDDEEKKDVQLEEQAIDAELILGELLGLAVNLDYADEIGRRKMFQLILPTGDILSQEVLPEGLVNKGLDVLRKLSENERDMIRVVVEIVSELRDVLIKDGDVQALKVEGTQAGDDRTTQWGDDERTQVGTKPAEPELSEEDLGHKLAIDLRCVTLCVGMLERVNSTLQENSALHGLVPELIIPSIQSKSHQLRERGLMCLGLCCLIDKRQRMTAGSYQLFVNQVQTASFELKKKVLPVLYDLIMVHHDAEYLREARMINFLMHQLEDEEDEIQAITCIGFAKLLLAGIVTDEKVLRSLVASYLQPDTADNQPLRQCLSYFFPVYCYSSSANQRMMQKESAVFMVLFKLLCEVYRDKDEDQEMISPAQLGALFLDWMDPLKVVEVQGQQRDESVHADVACDIVRELFEKEMDKEERKVLVQLLGKLYLPDELDNLKILTLHLLIKNLRRRRPLRETATRNAFAKFEISFKKKYNEQLTGMSEADHEAFQELHIQELQRWIDEIEPDSDAEEVAPPSPTEGKRTVRRRAKSATASRAESVLQEDQVGSGTEGEEEEKPEVEASEEQHVGEQEEEEEEEE